MLQKEPDRDRWRVLWAGAVALLRAVGSVLNKVDERECDRVRIVSQAAYKRWKSDDPAHAVFREFVKKERDLVLKQYESVVHPLAEVGAVIRLTLLDPVTGETKYHEATADFDENMFRPIVEGYGAGEDARDVYEGALDWWERELSVIEAASGGVRPETAE